MTTTNIVIILLVLTLIAVFIDWREVFARLSSSKGDTAFRSKKMASKTDYMLPDSSQAPLDLPVAAHFSEPAQYSDPVAVSNLPQHLQEWLDTADAHFRKGEYKAAEDLYIKVAAEDPRCSKAYARLGVIYLELGEEFADAEAAFRQALKIEPNNGNLLNNLGLVLYHQDKFAEAVRVFEQSVRLDESNASRHANLGMAYLAMRQYAKAESSFKKALKLAPGEIEYKDLLEEAVEKKLAHRTMVRR